MRHHLPSAALLIWLAACSRESAGTPPPASPPAAQTPTGTPPTGAQPAAPAPAAGPIGEIDAFIAAQKIDKTGEWKTRLPAPPKVTFDDKTYFWQLDTSKGPIRIKLMPKIAPMHVSSTIYLTRLGFYDGLRFHRVIPGFMAQGGDPVGNGSGSPGYGYEGEFDPAVRHDRPGLLSMANRGPGTDGSQFFLTFVPTPHLDDRHTIFGEVVEGMEALRALEAAGSPSGKPREPLEIRTATIVVGG